MSTLSMAVYGFWVVCSRCSTVVAPVVSVFDTPSIRLYFSPGTIVVRAANGGASWNWQLGTPTVERTHDMSQGFGRSSESSWIFCALYKIFSGVFSRVRRRWT